MTDPRPFASHRVQVYYEDTDLSGAVYHANYLKYCERAREHLIGPQELAKLYNDHGIGFVVYRAELTYRKSAMLADLLDVRTRIHVESRYRAIFHQDIHRLPDDAQPIVNVLIHLVCVDQNQQLVPLPDWVYQGLKDLPSP